MNMDTLSPASSRARQVYELLQELDRHISAQDASGRALLYQAKEGLRLLMISIDRPDAP
jgi:hypothetical protein